MSTSCKCTGSATLPKSGIKCQKKKAKDKEEVEEEEDEDEEVEAKEDVPIKIGKPKKGAKKEQFVIITIIFLYLLSIFNRITSAQKAEAVAVAAASNSTKLTV